MIGAGIFSLPATFGRATGGLGAIIAWCIAGFGMLMLAFVFQTLARRRPDLDSGIYAYASAGFGSYLGFASAFGFWAGTCIGASKAPARTVPAADHPAQLRRDAAPGAGRPAPTVDGGCAGDHPRALGGDLHQHRA